MYTSLRNDINQCKEFKKSEQEKLKVASTERLSVIAFDLRGPPLRQKTDGLP